MPIMTEAPMEALGRVAAEAACWLASPAAQGSVTHRRNRIAHFFKALDKGAAPGSQIRVDPLEAPPVEDGSPMATFLTLTLTLPLALARTGTRTSAEFGVLVIYGAHTALLVAQAGVAGCRIARLDPDTGEFLVTEAAHRIPPSGPVEFLGGRTVGAALYRVLLAGGAVVGPGLDPDVLATGRLPIRDRTAALLLDAAGGEWISSSAFGSTRVLGELATQQFGLSTLPVSPPPSLAEPLFGTRGLFRP